jgi:hypothetical protein
MPQTPRYPGSQKVAAPPFEAVCSRLEERHSIYVSNRICDMMYWGTGYRINSSKYEFRLAFRVP